MQLIFSYKILRGIWFNHVKNLGIMKIITCFMLFSCLQVSAIEAPLKVSLNENRSSLEAVLKKIGHQTGYSFLYESKVLRKASPVTLKVSDASLGRVLDLCFRNQPLTYKVFEKTVVIKEKLMHSSPRKEEPEEEGHFASLADIVTGKVTNSKAEPLVGVSVIVKGADIATSTEENGTFSIDVASHGTLVFSYVGFATMEIPVNGRSYVDVVLEESISELDQVVVVGYGTQGKKDLTGAISVVDVDNLSRQPTGLITDQLQGQAAGITITGSGQPGESPQVLIRGINTFGNNNPLYIVNGVPTQEISNLNPNDVASIQVLKDAGAASIYGSRASNGVIIITTKKGRGNLSVSYAGFYGIQEPKGRNPLQMLNPMEQAELRFLASANSGQPISESNPDLLYGPGPKPVLPDYIAPLGARFGDTSVDPSLYYVNPHYTDKSDLDAFYRITQANKSGTNWYRELFRNAPITSHNISASGSNDNANYFFSLNYLGQNGNVINTYLKRYTVSSNTSFKIGKGITIGENMQYSVNENPTINSRHNSLYQVFEVDPIVPVHDIMGNFAGVYGTKLGGKQNPVATASRTKENRNSNQRVLGNIFVDVDIIKNVLTYHSSFGADIASGFRHSFQFPQYENNENNSQNVYSESTNSFMDFTWFNTLEFHKIFDGVHDLRLLAGTEANRRNERMSSASVSGFYSFDPDYVSLSTGTGTRLSASNKNELRLWSQFLRGNYVYNDKYLLSFTVRRDGSSRFSREMRFGWFPSASIGWRLSEERFLRDYSWVSDLKLRASYGVMGNEMNVSASNAFSTFIRHMDGSFYDIAGSNNSLTSGFQVGQIGNPDARWEKNKNLNVGVDFSFFANRYDLTIDYFNKRIDGLLFNPSLLATEGNGIPPFVNIAGMENKGIDLSFTSRHKLGNDLSFESSLSFTHYKNKITRVSETRDFFDTPKPGGFSDASYIRNKVDYPVSSFYAYKVIGLWKTQLEIDEANSLAKNATQDDDAVYQTGIGLGRFRYMDVDKDGIITPNDRTFIGDPQPDFTYGVNLGITFKNFDFSTFLYGVYGNDIMNALREKLDFHGVHANSKRALYDSWTPDRPNATVPIQELSTNFSASETPSSYFLEKGSYLRMRNVQLGYTLFSNRLKRIGVQNLRVYLQGANLFTITNYSGLDPEVLGNISEYDVTNQGVDAGSYPAPRQYIFGFNLTF